jgi:hypothetical protein
MALLKRPSTVADRLNMAEYISIAGCVAGSVAAAVSQQVFYAAAPLTLALSFSLADRQRSQQQIQQQIVSTTADVHVLVQSLQHQVQELPSAKRVSEVETSAVKLSATTRQLEQTIQAVDTRRELDSLMQAFSNRPELQEIYSLKKVVAQLLHRLEQLPPETELFDPAPLTVKISELERSVVNLQESTATAIAEVRQLFSKQIEALHSGLEALPPPTELHELCIVKTALTELIKQFDALAQQFNTRPEPQAIEQLERMLALIKQRLNELANPLEGVEFSTLQAGLAAVEDRLVPLEALDLNFLHQAITQIQTNLNTLLDQLPTNLEPCRAQIDQLQERLLHLFKLTVIENPPSNMASPSHRELNLTIDNMASILSNLQSLQEQIHQQSHKDETLEEAVEKLQLRFQIISHLCSEIQELKRQQLVQNQTRETQPQLENLDEALAALRADINELQQSHQSLAQLNYLKQVNELEPQIETKEISQQIQGMQKFSSAHRSTYEYKLVFDRSDSRNILEETLEAAHKRIILVCPWLSYGTDDFVIHKLERLVGRNVRVDIGWGYGRDVEQVRDLPGPLTLRRRLNNYSTYYSALNRLERLEASSQQFSLKLLGTHEKFLVCDNSFAMLGSHNFLSSGSSKPEREVGLRTNDPQIITSLIERFENAENLEESCGRWAR